MIINQKNGILIEKLNSIEFVNSVKEVLLDKEKLIKLSKNCVMSSKRYSRELIGPKFIQVLSKYKSL